LSPPIASSPFRNGNPVFFLGSFSLLVFFRHSLSSPLCFVSDCFSPPLLESSSPQVELLFPHCCFLRLSPYLVESKVFISLFASPSAPASPIGPSLGFSQHGLFPPSWRVHRRFLPLPGFCWPFLAFLDYHHPVFFASLFKPFLAKAFSTYFPPLVSVNPSPFSCFLGRKSISFQHELSTSWFGPAGPFL